MPTLFSCGRYRIVIFANDHGPPHVHVVGPGHAKFLIGNAPDGVVMIEQEGITARALRRIAAEIIDRHPECLAGWKRFHGN